MEDFLSGVEKQLFSKSLHFLAIYWDRASEQLLPGQEKLALTFLNYELMSPHLHTWRKQNRRTGNSVSVGKQLVSPRETNKRQRLTCHAVRQDVHIRWPHGSIFTSLSFSAHILHSWNVEPISQYSSYCSLEKRWTDVVDTVKQAAGFISATRNPRQNGHSRNRRKWTSGFPRFSFRCPKTGNGGFEGADMVDNTKESICCRTF